MYNKAKMQKLVKADKFLSFMHKNMMSKGKWAEENILEVIFNGEVRGDSVMMNKYKTIR